MEATRIVKIDSLNPRHSDLKEAGNVINSGGLVIIPTETVYGIAANMLNKDSINRLYKIKKRPNDKPFTIHIAEKGKMEEFSRNIPLAAYKLSHKFWPGPLTMILKSSTEGTVGLRLPDDAVARGVIEHAGVPVVCPSANLSGRPAPVSFEDAIIDLNGLVDLAIDTGRTRLGVESTIVDLTQKQPLVIVREGAIKKEDIEKTVNTKTVLFVCTGNSCRSVMAEALLKKKLIEKKKDSIDVSSAGLMTVPGLGASSGTKEILRREGIDVSTHHSRIVSKELVKGSDLILTMEKIHEERILQIAPEVKNRMFLLKEFAKIKDSNLNVEDPMGKPMEVYERTFQTIREAVERVADIL